MMIAEGSVVKSIAGHDKNRFFAVLRLEGDFAFIADGRARKMGAPKKKRLKHLAPTLSVFVPGTVLTDKQLRAALARFSAEAPGETSYQEGSEAIG